MVRLPLAACIAFLGFAAAPAGAADEDYTRYIYNSDGTYERAADDRTGSYGVGNVDAYAGYDQNAGTSWGLRGSLASSVNGHFVVQLDAGFESAETNGLGATLHASRRVWDSAIIGAFLQASQDSISDVAPVTTTVIGAQAGYQGEVLSLQGGLGFGTTGTSIADDQISQLFASARFYVHDDLAVTASLRAQAIDLDFGNTGYGEAAIRADWRLASRPVSLYGEVGYREYYSAIGGAAIDSNMRGLAGVKYHFSSDSLRDEERSGLFWRR